MEITAGDITSRGVATAREGRLSLRPTRGEPKGLWFGARLTIPG